jgi:hypothetical protein
VVSRGCLRPAARLKRSITASPRPASGGRAATNALEPGEQELVLLANARSVLKVFKGVEPEPACWQRSAVGTRPVEEAVCSKLLVRFPLTREPGH